MAIFKCKMCGGTIEFEEGATVGVCDSCGTKQTLPRLDGDRKANLYDRANHFRRNNDFDKAMGIYEQILNEDNTDAEAYWSIVLCRYGIEYVEDPASHKRIPTVNRAQLTSIYADEDYKSAILHADSFQKQIYEDEARTIDDIQKGILEISSKEEPFDVFICYKETSMDGRRTLDSVLATELYHELEREGFKVFFSRITLEDKLGTAYEPYIFAALNSAKVMVAVGTKPEYFNAVWVKNEWSRYLTLIKNGERKTLIPAYRDMNPYDLPEEFSHLQAQDMNKLGFMQDLIRGISKIVRVEDSGRIKQTVTKTVVANPPMNPNVTPLLKRVFIFLEDGDWNSADEYCEKVLDMDPECAEAYLGKLMAELRIKTRDGLKDCEQPFDNLNNYQKAVRFGQDGVGEELQGIIGYINERNENARLERSYISALDLMKKATNEADFYAAKRAFENIAAYKDSQALANECEDKAENVRRDVIYRKALDMVNPGALVSVEGQILNLQWALKLFEQVRDHKDSEAKIAFIPIKIEELKQKAEEQRIQAERKAEERRIAAEMAAKKRKKAFAIGTPIVALCIVFVIVLTTVRISKVKLNNAMSMIDSGDYDTAYKLLEELGESNLIASNKYDRAKKLIEDNKLEEAYDILSEINFSYSETVKASIEPQVEKIRRDRISQKLKDAQVGNKVTLGDYNQGTGKKTEIIWRVLEKEGNKLLLISEKVLDGVPYSKTYTSGIWETCTLRKWLNSDFYDVAFSKTEKNFIIGKVTNAKVFCLSINEVEKLFKSDSDRICYPTDYAKTNGVWTNDKGACSWWLRSPGTYWDYPAYVSSGGSVTTSGYIAIGSTSGVRPALWVNLEP